MAATATMPPSTAGLRLKNAFEAGLPRLGVRTFSHHQVLKVDYRAKTGFQFEVRCGSGQMIVRSKGAVLASGRFLGGGLHGEELVLAVCPLEHAGDAYVPAPVVVGGSSTDAPPVQPVRAGQDVQADPSPVDTLAADDQQQPAPGPESSAHWHDTLPQLLG